jgi:DMSO/TMAO reductase YedYZ molybdopterin-dependent catalytic subunit/mono/diheme cytochrome c family protein
MDKKSRRDFLRAIGLGSGAVVLSACVMGAAPLTQSIELPKEGKTPDAKGLAGGLNPENFHIYNERPLSLETRRSRMASSPITPAALLFIRNNRPMPDAAIVQDPDSWILEIKGVDRPGTLSVAQLKTLGRSFEVSVLQCSGNGRAFFEHGPSGSPWALGAAGCVVWGGVRVSQVALFLGNPSQGMQFLTATGGETLPEDLDRDTAVVERSIPIEKGLKDCLLAWEMNGEPIPITHGGPLRLIVPGYFGCNNIKYVKTLAFTEAESTAKIQRSSYRFRPIGEKGNPSQPSLWRMPVKSWLNGPGADGEPVAAGLVHFHGVAFSGERGVRKVEVSLDKGKTWEEAVFDGPKMGANAWRSFHIAVELEPGKYSLVSRATDMENDVQAQSRVENERGYRHNGWEDAALTVQVLDELSRSPVATQAAPVVASAEDGPGKEAKLSPSGLRGKDVFQDKAQPNCGACHTLSDAGTTGSLGPNLDALQPDQAKTTQAVRNGVGIMPSFGESLSADQIQDLAQYIHEATK